MQFSVIIPCYNRLPLLRYTLESVWKQTFTNYEVIVVDDGSTDGTRDWLASQGSRLRVVVQSNRGPGAARNLAVHHVQGEYLAFLDSDDVWFPWSLDSYASVLREHRNPAFIAGKPFRFREEKELSGATPTPVKTNAFPDYLASGSEWRWWGVSSFVIRAETFQACGGFMEANLNSEDADLALKLGVAKEFVQIALPTTFGYREHAANVTADLGKTFAGVWQQVRTEAAGGYPGGTQRAQERWQILTRHVRPVALGCLRAGRRGDAWQLYRATFRWHWALGRWKFLAGFPLRALTS